MKIKNISQLAVTETRRTLLAIAEAGLEAIDTEILIREVIKISGGAIRIGEYSFAEKDIEKLIIIALGKCAVGAARIAEEILGKKITGGIAFSPAALEKQDLRFLTPIQGTHPLPSKENIEGSERVVEMVRGLTEKDLVVFIISGGASTLLCLPPSHDWSEEAEIFMALTKKGARIEELNTVRKHISGARGGFLSKYAYPARQLSLIFSDVPGGNIRTIASGPTVRDMTTITDAEAILKKYGVRRKPLFMETPKEEKYFRNSLYATVVSNETALKAMVTKASRVGYSARIMTTRLEGEARKVGKSVLHDLRRARLREALLYGGETTVSIRGSGRGGRNLELALAALGGVQRGEVLLTLASDGHDNGPFAGALCDTITRECARSKNLHIDVFLRDNDSYSFFEQAGDYLVTGDTGSNVSDLIVAMRE